MIDNDLGLFKDYGHLIISICLIVYAILYGYLAREYEEQEL